MTKSADTMNEPSSIFTTCRPLHADERLAIWSWRYAQYKASPPAGTHDVEVLPVLHTGAPCTRSGVPAGFITRRADRG